MNALLTRERTATVSSVFHCEDCTGDFPVCGHLVSEQVSCPKCGARGKSRVVAIYRDDDPDLHQMYSKVDWRAGD